MIALLILIRFFDLGIAYSQAMPLIDPANQAVHLREFFQDKTKSPFVCGIPVKFKQKLMRCDFKCEKNPCEQRCEASKIDFFEMQAENCSTDKVDIFSSLSWQTSVSQKSSPQFGQTWIEEFLAAADFFIVPSGNFEIVFVMPPHLETLVNEYGEERNIESSTIILDYKQSPKSPAIQFELELDINERGLDQLLYFGMSNREEFFIKKWGLLR